MVKEVNKDNVFLNNFLDTSAVKMETSKGSQNPSFSLQSLKEKSSINPMRSIWNWFTSCFTAFWEFVCTVFCLRTPATQVVRESKKLSLEEQEKVLKSKKIVSKTEIFSIIRNSIVTELPIGFDKMILYIRHGSQVYECVFTEKEKFTILDYVEAWLNAQKSADEMVCTAYVFYNSSKTKTPQLSYTTFKIDAIKNLYSNPRTITMDRPSYITSIEKNTELLNQILPQLNKQVGHA